MNKNNFCPMCGEQSFFRSIDIGTFCETYLGGCGLGISFSPMNKNSSDLFFWKGECYSKKEFERFLRLQSFI